MPVCQWSIWYVWCLTTSDVIFISGVIQVKWALKWLPCPSASLQLRKRCSRRTEGSCERRLFFGAPWCIARRLGHHHLQSISWTWYLDANDVFHHYTYRSSRCAWSKQEVMVVMVKISDRNSFWGITKTNYLLTYCIMSSHTYTRSHVLPSEIRETKNQGVNFTPIITSVRPQFKPSFLRKVQHVNGDFNIPEKIFLCNMSSSSLHFGGLVVFWRNFRKTTTKSRFTACWLYHKVPSSKIQLSSDFSAIFTGQHFNKRFLGTWEHRNTPHKRGLP